MKNGGPPAGLIRPILSGPAQCHVEQGFQNKASMRQHANGGQQR